MNSYIALGETDDNEYLSKDGSPVSDQVAAKFLTIMYGRLYEKNSLIQNRRSLSKYESLFEIGRAHV